MFGSFGILHFLDLVLMFLQQQEVNFLLTRQHRLDFKETETMDLHQVEVCLIIVLNGLSLID